MYAETAAQVQAEVQVPLPCWAALSVVKALRRQYSSQNNIHLGSTMVFTPKHCTGPRPAHPPGLDFSSWHKAHEDEKQCLVSLRAWRITFNFKALSWNEARKNIYMLKTICLNKKKKKKETGGLVPLCHTLARDSNKHLWGQFSCPPFRSRSDSFSVFYSLKQFHRVARSLHAVLSLLSELPSSLNSAGGPKCRLKPQMFCKSKHTFLLQTSLGPSIPLCAQQASYQPPPPFSQCWHEPCGGPQSIMAHSPTSQRIQNSG